MTTWERRPLGSLLGEFDLDPERGGLTKVTLLLLLLLLALVLVEAPLLELDVFTDGNDELVVIVKTGASRGLGAARSSALPL